MVPYGLAEPYLTPYNVRICNDEDAMMLDSTPDGRVTRNEAARFLGFKPKTLANWQRLGIGPASVMIGGRRFYHLDELKAYAAGEKSVRPSEAA